jgi:transposase
LPLLSRKEKEKLVIKLANEGKTTREIAKIVHISLKDIGKIINRETGDAEVLSKQDKQKQKQKRLNSLSPYAQAFQMFRENKTLSGIVVELDLDANTVLDYHRDYLRLVRMDGLVKIYLELKDDFPVDKNIINFTKKSYRFIIIGNGGRSYFTINYSFFLKYYKVHKSILKPLWTLFCHFVEVV